MPCLFALSHHPTSRTSLTCFSHLQCGPHFLSGQHKPLLSSPAPEDFFCDPPFPLLTSTLRDHCNFAVSDPRILLDQVSCTKTSGQALTTTLCNGTASIIGDGSCKGNLQQGSLAFVVLPQPTRALLVHKAVGCNLTTGLPEDQSSCQS